MGTSLERHSRKTVNGRQMDASSVWGSALDQIEKPGREDGRKMDGGCSLQDFCRRCRCVLPPPVLLERSSMTNGQAQAACRSLACLPIWQAGRQAGRQAGGWTGRHSAVDRFLYPSVYLWTNADAQTGGRTEPKQPADLADKSEQAKGWFLHTRGRPSRRQAVSWSTGRSDGVWGNRGGSEEVTPYH